MENNKLIICLSGSNPHKDVKSSNEVVFAPCRLFF
jgi:hypothetical protein